MFDGRRIVHRARLLLVCGLICRQLGEAMRWYGSRFFGHKRVYRLVRRKMRFVLSFGNRSFQLGYGIRFIRRRSAGFFAPRFRTL
ncbi:MAG: hypothetical protein WB624_12815, partial [Xanthobacteraceae bacterium]